MDGLRRISGQDGSSHATGYAVIAGALCLSLLITIPMAAVPLARLTGWFLRFSGL